ncbi:membrane hypothetical protein [uncultured delta proteobacterium]|uniref:Uncharacterized protein n=1 Tax=uncultured delta proteobacterium TaxID=34034 RepID=A0A212J071_9DELT|nr:membrane hypothetical protein [uncultured delta proteobacterium]
MRTLQRYGAAAVFSLTWAGILLAGTAITPGCDLPAAALMAMLVYAVWINGVALTMFAGNALSLKVGEIPRAYGFLAVVAGVFILAENGAGVPALTMAAAGALALFLCMPLLRGLRAVAQPLSLAAAFSLFVLSPENPLAVGHGVAAAGGVLAAAILGMWLWTRLLGRDAPARAYLLNPTPALLASFAAVTASLSLTTVCGSLLLAWGFCIVARACMTEEDVARTLRFQKASGAENLRIAA